MSNESSPKERWLHAQQMQSKYFPNLVTGNIKRKETQAELVHLEPEQIYCLCTRVDDNLAVKREGKKREGAGYSGCTKDDCMCYKNGAGCTEECSCSSCTNPFDVLRSFFGKDGVWAGSCFRQWLNSEKTDLSCPTVQERLRSQLFAVKEGDLDAQPRHPVFGKGYDKQLAQLGKDWTKPGVTDAERQTLLKQLFRSAYGVGHVGKKKFYYSFCRDQWEKKSNTWHCETCGQCDDWRSWHCVVCDRCTYGIAIPCQVCGGVSKDYNLTREAAMCTNLNDLLDKDR